jgi:hypothetical protein
MQKQKPYRVLLSGPEVVWEHRDAAEFWEQNEDGTFLRHYARHERDLADAHKDHTEAEAIIERELARLRDQEAGDRVPRAVLKRAEADVTVLADSPDDAAELALDANPGCDTVESVTALEE